MLNFRLTKDQKLNNQISPFTLFVHNFANFSTKTLELNEENVCYQAIVPCLTLLEGSIQRPVIFGHLVKFLLKVGFNWF